jgi:hypothetical protein
MSKANAVETVGCAKSTDGKLWLICAAKRTYSFGGGRLRLADEQQPLLRDPEIEDDGHGRMRTLRDDMDLHAPKVATDVVLTGSAYSPAGSVRELQIAVAVGNNARVLKVLGERRAEVSIEGHVRFSDPLPFESLRLSWELSYGGYDAYAHDELYPPKRKGGRRIEPSPRDEGVFAYPRNKVGRGYFIDVDRDRADGELLPQIEDPADPLTTSRFFVAHPRKWLDAPVSAGLGWVAHTWYPRVMRGLGGFLEHDPPAAPIREMSFADGADLAGPFRKNDVFPRFLQGAAPGLACERLHGDEMVILQNLVRVEPGARFRLPGERPSITVRLPGERPSITVRPPGSLKAFTPEAVLQTVRIDTDAQTVSLVWCGAVRLIAPLSSDALPQIAYTCSWSM